jgi:hypothetical protein
MEYTTVCSYCKKPCVYCNCFILQTTNVSSQTNTDSYWYCQKCGLEICEHETFFQSEKIKNTNQFSHKTEQFIEICGTGSFKFRIPKNMIPNGSYFDKIVNGFFTNSVLLETRQILHLPSNIVFVPFSDGVLKLIQSYFFEEVIVNGFKIQKRRNYNIWPNPILKKNIDSLEPVTSDDLEFLNYRLALVHQHFPPHVEKDDYYLSWKKSQTRSIPHKEFPYFTDSFYKILQSSKIDIKLLPEWKKQLYPTATFIKILADYLNLPFVIEEEDKIKTFMNDFRIINNHFKKLGETKRRQKNITNFLNGLRRRIDKLHDFETKIDNCFNKIGSINLVACSEEEILELAFPLISMLRIYFHELHIIQKKKTYSFFKCADIELQCEVNKFSNKMKQFDCHYVYSVERLFNTVGYYFGIKNSLIEPSIFSHYDEKNCNHLPNFSSKYMVNDVVNFLISSYSGCCCNEY